MNSLLIATTNRGKVEEFFYLLRGLDFELVTPADLGIEFTIEENGTSYAENASLKARAYCRVSRLVTLADDSGLEVDALGGAPGIFSARYSPEPGANDSHRRAFLLKNLTDHERPWKAAFHAAIAIAIPANSKDGDARVELFTGICRGEIIPDERGTNGFGYDPIFFFTELNRTMAELATEDKNRISHRALAVQAAVPLLKNLTGMQGG